MLILGIIEELSKLRPVISSTFTTRDNNLDTQPKASHSPIHVCYIQTCLQIGRCCFHPPCIVSFIQANPINSLLSHFLILLPDSHISSQPQISSQNSVPNTNHPDSDIECLTDVEGAFLSNPLSSAPDIDLHSVFVITDYNSNSAPNFSRPMLPHTTYQSTGNCELELSPSTLHHENASNQYDLPARLNSQSNLIALSPEPKNTKHGYATLPSDRSHLLSRDPKFSSFAISHTDSNYNGLGLSRPKNDTNSDNDEDDDSDIETDDPTSLEEVLEPLPEPLTPEGGPDYLSWTYFGIIMNYVLVGLYVGFFDGTMFPVFSQLLALPSYRSKAAIQAINIWWSAKIFLAAISDTIPIFGYKRKYYILLGWMGAGIITFGAILYGQPNSDTNPLILTTMFSAITLCYLLADVAFDANIVTLSRRESLEKRGSIQSTAYLCRYIASIFSGLVMSFGFNGPSYGGSFDIELKIPWYLSVILSVNVFGWIFFSTTWDIGGQQYKSYFGNFYTIFQRIKLKVVAKCLFFSFFVHFFAYLQNAAQIDLQKICGVTPLWDGLVSNVGGSVATSLSVYITKKYLLQVSWHKTLSFCIIGLAVFTYIPAILIDLNYYRTPAFATLSTLLTTFINGTFFVVCALCAIDISSPGTEGMTFALITTTNNLVNSLTILFSTTLMSMFEIYQADGISLNDTTAGRWEMFKLDTTLFMLHLCGLFALLLLPRQKQQLHRELKKGEEWPRTAVCIVICLFVCFVYSVTGNFLMTNESTACLKIIGGKGCD